MAGQGDNKISFKVKLARTVMNVLPSKPKYDIQYPRSETINHRNFIDANEEEKKRILFEMAKNHYLEDENKPFDHYFPGYSLKKLLSGKKVLDLGCWCGGRTVACAERWHVKSMYGMDVNEYFIKAAILFSSKRENKDIKYDFRIGFGEALPYKDCTFDAIFSCDVLEHVKSVKDTITECKRTLKPGGMLFSVFPSYYCPFGGQHLGIATRMPCLNWVFDAKTLNIAFHEIIESRGEEAYWYKSRKKEEDDWRTLHGGIGINGTTFRKYRSVIEEVGFSKIHFLPTPLLSVGNMSIRHPKVKYFSKALKPLLKIDFLKDCLSHRFVSVMVV